MIRIREADFETCVELSNQIPEFQNPYAVPEYQKRCNNAVFLSLVAEIDNQPAGFKIGYDRFCDGSFYSWIGGVIPKYRRIGVAEALANHQENWAKQNGFASITLKTRKKHEAMIVFSMNRGFSAFKEEMKTDASETRIWMEKKL